MKLMDRTVLIMLSSVGNVFVKGNKFEIPARLRSFIVDLCGKIIECDKKTIDLELKYLIRERFNFRNRVSI